MGGHFCYGGVAGVGCGVGGGFVGGFLVGGGVMGVGVFEAVAEEVEEAVWFGGGGFLFFRDVEDGFGPSFFVVEEGGCGEEEDGKDYGAGLWIVSE